MLGAIDWNDSPLSDAHKALLCDALQTTEAHIWSGETEGYDVSLSVIPAEEMRALNRRHRGINRPTDVLSFPGFAHVGNYLGDIVICADVAEEQAREYGHSIERELTFLAVHGMLHLLGFDHINPDDEQKMLAAQNKIMGIIGVER